MSADFDQWINQVEVLLTRRYKIKPMSIPAAEYEDLFEKKTTAAGAAQTIFNNYSRQGGRSRLITGGPEIPLPSAFVVRIVSGLSAVLGWLFFAAALYFLFLTIKNATSPVVIATSPMRSTSASEADAMLKLVSTGLAFAQFTFCSIAAMAGLYVNQRLLMNWHDFTGED